jgi:hypothetical protein
MVVQNILYKQENGDLIDADETNSDKSFILNNMLNYALDGATTTNQNNIKVDLFGSDTAQYLSFMEYDSGNDLYKCINTSSAYYVIIEATSTTATSSGNIVITPMASGKWMVYDTTDNYEVGRAKIIEYLFKPTSNTDATTAKIKANFTGITAIKTADSNDSGRQVWFVYLRSTDTNNNFGDNATKTVDFVNTTTNTAASTWSRVDYTEASGAASSSYEFPTGTTVNSKASGSGTPFYYDEYGTDRSADEYNNPTQLKMITNGGLSYGSAFATSLVLTKGTYTNVVATAGTGQSITGNHTYDFTADGSIPAFTTVTESDLTPYLITGSTTITTSEDISIVRSINSLTGSNTVSTEVTFDNGSNWLSLSQGVITKLTNLGTSMRFKFTINRAANTETDSITSYAAYYS